MEKFKNAIGYVAGFGIVAGGVIWSAWIFWQLVKQSFLFNLLVG